MTAYYYNPLFVVSPGGSSLPPTGTSGEVFYLTTGDIGMYVCGGSNAWTKLGATTSSEMPSFSGAYTDLTGKPTLGTAAATAIGDYATAAQGTTANSALQPAGNGSALTGLTKSQVSLGNVDNTSDANKPVSNATQTALNLKANLASPTFTGTVAGVTKAMVGLTNVDDTTDAGKPVSTATQTALNGKISTGGLAGTATALATARAINGVNFDGTAPITVTAAGSTLSDTVTVAKGGTGLATLTAFALQVGNGTSAPAQLSAVAIGQVLASKGTGANPAYVTYAATMATPANQTGNATATFKMNGLGAAAAPATITPTATGRVVFHITGSIGNGTTADSVTWKLAYGTGAAPANAAAATGTVIGATGVFKALTGQLDAPFIAMGLATGLALNTAVWYDLQIADITGGTVTATAVTCMAWEV